MYDVVGYDDWQKALVAGQSSAASTQGASAPTAGSPPPSISQSWLRAHGSTTGLPQPHPSYQPHIRLPGFQTTPNGSHALDDEEHHRCGACHSLLPPQFCVELDSAARGFALTVAGKPQTGKTTWLTAMLNSPDTDTFDILRRDPDLSAEAYPYAEPLSMRVLIEMPTRTTIPYMLLGSTVDVSDGVFFVSALDIMGERFGFEEAQTKAVIQRHLRASPTGGALLLVNKFEPHLTPGALMKAPPPASTASALMSIARIYEDVRHSFRDQRDKRSDATSVWSGVIWSHLDTAAWSTEAETWLQTNAPRLADPLTRLGRLSLNTAAPLAPDWLDLLKSIDGPFVWDLANHLLKKLDIKFPYYETTLKAVKVQPPASVSLPNPAQIDGLIALLLRLQVLYSIGACNYSSKAAFLSDGGGLYVEGVLALARALFILWDVPRGQLHQYVRRDFHFVVLPAGRVSDAGVWSDLALWQMLTEAKDKGWQ